MTRGTFGFLAASAVAFVASWTGSAGAASVYSAVTDSYYDFVPGTYEWLDALADAKTRTYAGRQGHLVTITSQAENDIVRSFGQRGWLGGSDLETEGVWKWADGPDAGLIFWNAGPIAGVFSNFELGEPNNQSPGEDALEMWGPLNGDGSSWGRWNDTAHQDDQGYFIEYSTPVVPTPTAAIAALVGLAMPFSTRPTRKPVRRSK